MQPNTNNASAAMIRVVSATRWSPRFGTSVGTTDGTPACSTAASRPSWSRLVTSMPAAAGSKPAAVAVSSTDWAIAVRTATFPSGTAPTSASTIWRCAPISDELTTAVTCGSVLVAVASCDAISAPAIGVTARSTVWPITSAVNREVAIWSAARSARAESSTDIRASCELTSAPSAIANIAAQNPAIASCAVEPRPSVIAPS